MYECQKCGKAFSKKSHYEDHHNISASCVEIKIELPAIEYKKYICNKCETHFSTKGNLVRHLNGNTLCKSMYIVKKKLDQVLAKTNANNISIQNTNTQNIQNIQNTQNIQNILQPIFVKGGKENMKHITKEVVLALLNMNSFTWICTSLMQSSYFSRLVPENNNWCLVYPNNENAAVVFDHEKNKFKRDSTENTINEKFRNMMELLIPVLLEIIEEEEATGFLNKTQKRNLFRIKHFTNVDELSNESTEIYESIHKMAYKEREIPMETWRKNGYKGNHLSLKF